MQIQKNHNRTLVADLNTGEWSDVKTSLGGRRVELDWGQRTSMRYYGENAAYRVYFEDAECDFEDNWVGRIEFLHEDKCLIIPDGIIRPRTVRDAVKYLDILDGCPSWVYEI